MLQPILHGAHRALFNFRYALRSRRWRPAERRPRPVGPDILTSGYFDEALGIGRAGRLVANRLEVLGYSIIREDLRPYDHGLLRKAESNFSSPAPVWLTAVNPPEARLALYGHRPSLWNDMYRIGLWAWESDLAPASWAALVEYFHEIWVPSRFVAEALTKSLQEIGRTHLIDRISVHPHPVDIPPITPTSGSGRVQVLSLFDPRSHFERKNPMAVVKVWLELFPKPSQIAHLTLKTLTDATKHPHFATLVTAIDGRPDISLRAETLDAQQTQAMINASDIIVSLHRAEGYGLPLAEAMAAGKAVMATGWSGNMEFMTPENSWPVAYNLVPAIPRYNGPQAQWAEPSLHAAQKGLSTLIQSQPLRQKLGRQARQDMTSIYEAWEGQRLWLP